MSHVESFFLEEGIKVSWIGVHQVNMPVLIIEVNSVKLLTCGPLLDLVTLFVWEIVQHLADEIFLIFLLFFCLLIPVFASSTSSWSIIFISLVVRNYWFFWRDVLLQVRGFSHEWTLIITVIWCWRPLVQLFVVFILVFLQFLVPFCFKCSQLFSAEFCPFNIFELV